MCCGSVRRMRGRGTRSGTRQRSDALGPPKGATGFLTGSACERCPRCRGVSPPHGGRHGDRWAGPRGGTSTAITGLESADQDRHWHRGTELGPCRAVPRVHAFGKGEQALRRDPRDPPALRGWLLKQDSSGLRLWKRRWFVLVDLCLYYYLDSSEQRVRGGLPLPGYEIRILPRAPRAPRFLFTAEHPGMRTYCLGAETPKERSEWVRALRRGAAALPRSPFSLQASEEPETTGPPTPPLPSPPLREELGAPPTPPPRCFPVPPVPSSKVITVRSTSQEGLLGQAGGPVEQGGLWGRRNLRDGSKSNGAGGDSGADRGGPPQGTPQQRLALTASSSIPGGDPRPDRAWQTGAEPGGAAETPPPHRGSHRWVPAPAPLPARGNPRRPRPIVAPPPRREEPPEAPPPRSSHAPAAGRQRAGCGRARDYSQSDAALPNRLS
ncbi:pleckstrin homology domain-containing family A member 4-like [Pogoniulus pusillus]|uniref:pleckstrin homology domain-containing family A member 4-like n=1 Tax=Pogoniulus pusillus TaxID=488313 RepID=UPI0030B932C7